MLDMFPRFGFINMTRGHPNNNNHHVNASVVLSKNAQYEWDIFNSVEFHKPYDNCCIGDKKLADLYY